MSEAAIKTITFYLGCASFVAGIIQYIANSWRLRKENIKSGAIQARDEMEKFNSDVDVRAAFRMLDWDASNVDVYRDGEKHVFQFDSTKFSSALRHHVSPDYMREDGQKLKVRRPKNSAGGVGAHYVFTEEEQMIRDVFDSFLGRLERVETLIKSGVVPQHLFNDYFSYWLALLDENNDGDEPIHLSEEKREAFWGFVRGYQYYGVVRLFSRYGKTESQATS